MPSYKLPLRSGRLLGGGDRGTQDAVPYQGPQIQSQAAVPVTTANQAHPLPILWGTGKLPAYMIEGGPPRHTPIPNWTFINAYAAGQILASDGSAWRLLKGGVSGVGFNPQGQGFDPPFWLPSHAYVVGNMVQNPTIAGSSLGTANLVFYCIKAGTSASSGNGPTSTGADVVDGGAHWQFMGEAPFPIVNTNDGLVWQYLQQLPYIDYFITLLCAVCEGEVQGALKLFWDQERYATQSATDLGKLLKLYVGPDAGGQAPSGGFDSRGYQHTVLIGPNAAIGRNVPVGTKNEVPALAIELQGVMFGSAVPDVNPADIVNDLLTHSRRGCNWPSSRVDAATITGTDAGSFRTYCDAAGLRFSMILDSQRAAIDILADILNATTSDAIWSGGALKIIPLGDQPITSPVYGAVNYSPPNIAQYNLSEVDFGDSVEIQVREDADCFNDFPVQYVDRFELYQQNTVEDPDQTDVEVRGQMWRGDTLSLPVVFPDGTAPIMLSRILAQRSLNIRRTLTFRLPYRYALLEPTDIVTLSDRLLGLSLAPVRLLTMTEEMQDNGESGWTCTAEDYPEGTAASNAYAPQPGDGYQPNNIGTTAGNIPGAFGVGALTGGGLDNLWPNPTSEISPPAFTPVANDGSSVEWDYRLNVGVGNARDGAWVRQLDNSAGAGNFTFRRSVACVQDEIFQFAAWLKTTVGTGRSAQLQWFDSTGTLLATSGGAAGAIVSSWEPWLACGRTPAAAVRVEAQVIAGAHSTVQADSLLFKRFGAAGPVGGLISYDLSSGIPSPDTTRADHFIFIEPTAATARSFFAPLSPFLGMEITYKHKNTSAGATGAATFAAVFKLAAWGAIASGFSRSIIFRYDGTNWVEVSRTPVDVTN